MILFLKYNDVILKRTVLKRNGFTLLELLVVVGIISIIAAIGALNLRTSVAGQDLQSSADQLISQVRTMQQISLQKSPADAANKVRISFSANSYQITTDGSASPARTLPTVNLPATVTLSGATALTFDPNNLANNARSMIVLTSSVSGNKRTLVIASETGRIRVDSSSSPTYLAAE